jgi:hypothetical protein
MPVVPADATNCWGSWNTDGFYFLHTLWRDCTMLIDFFPDIVHDSFNFKNTISWNNADGIYFFHTLWWDCTMLIDFCMIFSILQTQ